MSIKTRVDCEVLRAEAGHVKQCFTSFSFQALAVSVTVLAATFSIMDRFSWAVYAPLPAVGLLMAVCRIGIFKYATANRNCGYELHLARVKHIEASTALTQLSRWQPYMRKIEWEEALRAWRVVQPTLFRSIYVTPQTDRIALKLDWFGLGVLNFFRPSLYRINQTLGLKRLRSRKS
jgi:hypothetical protein